MQYNKNNLEKLCEICIDVAKSAGKKILYHYANFDNKKHIKIKLDQSPVTIADLASHHEIVNGLNNIIVDGCKFILPILSEENTELSTTARKQWQDYWLVDPLDGTKQFINKKDEFCINIALISNSRPILGVIYAPCTDTVYYGIRGHGAFKVISNSKAEKIQSKKIHIINGKANLTITTSRSHAKPSRHYDFIEKLSKAIDKFTTIHSGSAIKFGLIAEGSADIYPRFGFTYEWDTAAGDCILQEAGGKLFTLDGNEFLYNQKDSLINPEFYAVGDVHYDWQRLLKNAN